MRKSKALEIALVVLLIGGALTYQIMHDAAAKNDIVPAEAPVLPKQVTRDEAEEISEEQPIVVPSPPSREELLKQYLSGLKSGKVRKYNPHISSLGEAPDWAQLDTYQNTITKADFVRQIKEVYTVSDSWQKWIDLNEDHALITQSAGDTEAKKYRLAFADSASKTIQRSWRGVAELPAATISKPLNDVIIAIDPGHIGGEWAELEERNFSVKGIKPVREGEMTLIVAQKIKVALEQLGAEAILVRDKLAPVNPLRPEHYTHDAYEEIVGRGLIPSSALVDSLRKKMFYRIGEIRNRARIINSIIKPDFVICLHFNADSWGDPENPTLRDEHHFHVLLHGAYTDGELAKDDERFSMIKKILTRNHDEELALSLAVAETTAALTKLPAYQYEENSQRARKVGDNDYLWARNLLANRLYEAPIVYMEPYIMNSKQDYHRIQLGDYEGFQEVQGEQRLSIYNEYAKSVVDGVKKYFIENRKFLQKPTPVVEEAVNE